MDKELFLAISNKLSATFADDPKKVWIDFWNNQIDEPNTKSYPLFVPAVFIEIQETVYNELYEGVQRGDVSIVIHIVQEHYSDTYAGNPDQARALEIFDFTKRVYLAIQDLSGTNFTPLERTSQRLQERFDRIVKHEIRFKTFVEDVSKKLDNDTKSRKVNPDIYPFHIDKIR